MKLTDDSTIPATLRLHAGKPLIQVPADYLLWLADQTWAKTKYPDLCTYIEDNRKVLDAEQKEKHGDND